MSAPIAAPPQNAAPPTAKPVAPAPAARALSLEEQVYEHSLYSDSGDPVGDGEVWHVAETPKLFGEDGFTFDDFLDIINPLQHLPVVGTLYRSVTGDDLSPGSRILGGTLFGGAYGFAASLANAVIADETGSDLGGTVLAALGGEKTPESPAIAAKPPEPTTTAEPAAAAPAAPAAPATQSFPLVPTAAAYEPKEALTKKVRTDPLSLIPDTRRTDKAIAIPASAPALSTPKPASGPALPLFFQGPAQSATAAGPAAAAKTATPAPAAAHPPKPASDVSEHRQVPRLMQDALEKYEALMRSRQAPRVSDDI